MVGSGVPASAGPWSGAGAVAGCPSPAPEGVGAGVVVAGGEGAGVDAAGAARAGAGGDCGDGEGAVCANAPAQSDEIKKEVDASRRGRIDTEAPCREGRQLPRRMHELAHVTDRAGEVKVNSPQSPDAAQAVPYDRGQSWWWSVILSITVHTIVWLVQGFGPVTLAHQSLSLQKYYSAVET
jgi:hypothetical protein